MRAVVVRIALVKGRSDEVVDVGKEDRQDRHVDAAVCDHDTRYVSVCTIARVACAPCMRVSCVRVRLHVCLREIAYIASSRAGPS